MVYTAPRTGSTFTYGGVTAHGHAGPNGKPTVGGYSDKMVVHERFAICIPQAGRVMKIRR